MPTAPTPATPTITVEQSTAAQQSDLAQYAQRQALYSDFFETCLAHGPAKCRGQQIEARNPPAGGLFDGFAPLNRRIALPEPLVDGLS